MPSAFAAVDEDLETWDRLTGSALWYLNGDGPRNEHAAKYHVFLCNSC
jgi:hypothetical protein